jgi:hypothetical protein
LNVFSIKGKLGVPIALTQERYNKETNREDPYVRNVEGKVKSFALCPACDNPTMLVNRHITETDSDVLYAKHAGYSVNNLADHDQAAYEECPFHNPERFDNKIRRNNASRNNEIREALINHIHLVIKTLENSTGISYSDNLVESMLKDFGGNRGHEYKAISLYNLPFGFAYMTEAQDLYGCRVDDFVAKHIADRSVGFEVGNYSTVRRKKGKSGSDLRFYFNNHRIGDSFQGRDSMDMVVVEIQRSTSESQILCTKKLEFNSEFFFNTYKRRERLRLLAIQYL